MIILVITHKVEYFNAACYDLYPAISYQLLNFSTLPLFLPDDVSRYIWHVMVDSVHDFYTQNAWLRLWGYYIEINSLLLYGITLTSIIGIKFDINKRNYTDINNWNYLDINKQNYTDINYWNYLDINKRNCTDINNWNYLK